MRDRLRGDLVEHHPAGRDLGLEFLEKVPGDGLALAVLISGQQQFVGILEQRLQLRDLLLLVGVDDIERLEVGIHVDAETGPRLAAVFGGYLGSGVWHVADVPDAGLHYIALAEIAGDGARLRRRLDDDESPQAVAGGFRQPWRLSRPIQFLLPRSSPSHPTDALEATAGDQQAARIMATAPPVTPSSRHYGRDWPRPASRRSRPCPVLSTRRGILRVPRGKAALFPNAD